MGTRGKTWRWKRKPLEHYSMPEPNTGCWLWLGTIRRDGYGQK
jgi:hypothetical protein